MNSRAINGAAYVANSGLRRTIEKILPANFAARINGDAWTIPSVFGWLKSNVKGLTPEIIVDKFNCGIGLVMVVSKDNKKWQQIDGAVEIGELNNEHTSKITSSKRIFIRSIDFTEPDISIV